MSHPYEFLRTSAGLFFANREFGTFRGHITGEESASYVVDDMGDLVRCPDERLPIAFQISHRTQVCEWGWLALEREQARLEATLFRRQPAPVTAEITQREDDFWSGASITDIRIGRDDHPLSRREHFVLDVPSSDGPVWLSRAQLAAVLMAAEELIKPSRKARQAAPRALTSLSDPALPGAVAAAMDGTGPQVSLIGMTVTPLAANAR